MGAHAGACSGPLADGASAKATQRTEGIAQAIQKDGKLSATQSAPKRHEGRRPYEQPAHFLLRQ